MRGGGASRPRTELSAGIDRIQPGRRTLRAGRRCRPSRKPRTRRPGDRTIPLLGLRRVPRLAPARAIPASLSVRRRRPARIARSPRGAFCLVAQLALPTSPSPGSSSIPRDRSCGLCRVKARGAVSVAALHPAPTPALVPLTRRRSSPVLSRDDELRGTAAAAKRSPPTRQNGLRRDSESWGPAVPSHH